LLEAAAVIGKDVPMPLLLAIADAPEHEVRAQLTHLQAAEFLYETRLFPDLEYTFKHALTHEVAYGGLLHERQRALHARITAAIEQLAPERVGEQVERLAHHACAGSYGRRPSVICARPGFGRWRGPPIARSSPSWSRRWQSSLISARPGKRSSSPSTFASTSGRLSPRSASGRVWENTSTRRRRSPGGSATSAGSDGSPRSWGSSVWAPAAKPRASGLGR